jgi:hypothetical protein
LDDSQESEENGQVGLDALLLHVEKIKDFIRRAKVAIRFVTLHFRPVVAESGRHDGVEAVQGVAGGVRDYPDQQRGAAQGDEVPAEYELRNSDERPQKHAVLQHKSIINFIRKEYLKLFLPKGQQLFQ